jgi:hypothetical protein
MLTMFLRRDQGMIRCLVERTLAPIQGGTAAAQLWYDGVTFPDTESELPVDDRMLIIGGELFNNPHPSRRGVANTRTLGATTQPRAVYFRCTLLRDGQACGAAATPGPNFFPIMRTPRLKERHG